jgi:hypothetical protein
LLANLDDHLGTSEHSRRLSQEHSSRSMDLANYHGNFLVDSLAIFLASKVNRRYLAGEADDPKWELRMSLVFSSLFSLIVVSAFFLARGGIHPK